MYSCVIGVVAVVVVAAVVAVELVIINQVNHPLAHRNWAGKFELRSCHSEVNSPPTLRQTHQIKMFSLSLSSWFSLLAISRVFAPIETTQTSK